MLLRSPKPTAIRDPSRPRGLSEAPLGSAVQIRHDLLTPLTVVTGHAQLLRRDARVLPGLDCSDRARLTARAATIESAAKEIAAVVIGLADASGRR